MQGTVNLTQLQCNKENSRDASDSWHIQDWVGSTLFEYSKLEFVAQTAVTINESNLNLFNLFKRPSCTKIR